MSKTRFLKNMITAAKVEPTENHEAGVASGVWSTQDQLEARRGGVWPEAGITNPDTLIENIFAITLYDGNAGTQAINNGIDLAGKGGMVWIKRRDGNNAHEINDTVRGVNKHLIPNTTAAAASDGEISSFNSNGFSLQYSSGKGNADGENYVAWTFKKATKFFDIVTYAGTGSARTVAHSLGGTVGMILIKNLDQTDNWAVYHRASDASAPEDKYHILNTDNTIQDSANWWNDTAPTTSVFTVGTDHSVNADGENYVAYLFGHDTSSDGMIQCGAYAGNGTDKTTINLGMEAQYVMCRRLDGADDWHVYDDMRGFGRRNAPANQIKWNAAGGETTSGSPIGQIFSDRLGFMVDAGDLNSSGENYFYMAIRRPNMSVPTSARSVFKALNNIGDGGGTVTRTGVGFSPDWVMGNPSGGDNVTFSKVAGRQGTGYEMNITQDDSAAQNDVSIVEFTNDGFKIGSNGGRFNNGSAGSDTFSFRRQKGFLDIVTYEGNNNNRTIAHDLGVAPTMMWFKRRDASADWQVYFNEPTDHLVLNERYGRVDNVEFFNDTDPTSTVFTVGVHDRINANGGTFIAYLFANLAGIQNLGTVAHSGSSTDVDCGFTSGATFVMLKRYEAGEAGGWHIWSAAKGIVDGNDSYFTTNSTSAQVTNTDFIDPLAAGFTITGDFTDGTYLYWSIA